MKVKTLFEQDLNAALAAVTIHHFKFLSNSLDNTTRVLSKIIEKSENSIVYDAPETSIEIAKELNISLPVFIKFFNKLVKMGILQREKGNKIFIHPVASTPFSCVQIVSQEHSINLKNKKNGK